MLPLGPILPVSARSHPPKLALAPDTLDAFLLQRAQETLTGYRPFEDLLQQYEELFGEKLELPSFERSQEGAQT